MTHEAVPAVPRALVDAPLLSAHRVASYDPWLRVARLPSRRLRAPHHVQDLSRGWTRLLLVQELVQGHGHVVGSLIAIRIPYRLDLGEHGATYPAAANDNLLVAVLRSPA